VATALPPPPRKEDQRFDNWVFTLWKRAVGALVSGGVGATAPITITTAGTGTVNIGHGASGVVTGTYGSQSQIPIVAVDTYGHITLATSSAVAVSGTNITGDDLTVLSPLTGTATNALLRAGTIGHETSGVIGGTYGSQSSIPVVVVNTWGHLILATASAVAISGTNVTGADLTISSPLIGTSTNALLRAGTIGHGTSGVTGGTYGSASQVGRVVVDTWGHVTSAAGVDIAISGTAVTGANLTPGAELVGTATNALLRAGTIAHATSGAIPATYGNQSTVPILTVNTYGHITSATSSAIVLSGTAITGANLTVSSPLVGTATNALLRAGTVGHATSGVTGGTYGAASTVSQVVVDTWGHITSASSVNIALAGTAVTGANLTVSAPLAGTATNALLRAGTVGHAVSGVIGGTYGAASVIPQVVVDTWGHVTAINTLNVAVAGTAVTGADLTVNSPLLGTVTNALLRAGAISHSTSGVTGGTYGASGTVARVVVDTWGHVTGAAGVAIDHGAIAGLTDDDHTQYVLANGARAVTGTLTMANVAIATAADVTATTPVILSGTTTSAVLHPFVIAHATSGIVPGTFGGASSIPQVVVNTYGHVTAVSTFALSGTNVTGQNLTVNSPLQGTVTNALLRSGAISHGVSGVVTGTYGGALGIPRVIVNTYGHVTAGTSFPLQATAPIIVGSNAGTFTWGHSTSGIVSGTYGGSGVIPQIIVNTWGHVTAINTFGIDAGSTDYPMVKGHVPDGSSVTIDDGYQLLCVGMTVFGTGTIIVEGTGILAVL
jgi:hypothetical protein